MAQEARRSVIITFKPKDQRSDRATDKLDIVRGAITSEVSYFLDAQTMPRGFALPPALPAEMIGYDVNEYEAPIVLASLTDADIEALRSNENVAVVEEDLPCYALDERPSRLLEGLVFEGQPSPLAETVPYGISALKAPAAWECSQGKAIKVAVLDSGIDGTHPDLADNYKGEISFVPDESNPTDYNSHGTHCAGTIAARINGVGVVGVAPAAYLYAVKVLSRTGSGQFSWIIAGIDWCIKNGIRIVSMSLGGDSAPSALEAMCNAAWSKGLLLVAAAGNNGGAVGFPASYGSVVAVSAIDSSNIIASFSSRGPKVELCAPGVNVLSTIPGGGYGTKNGTSMACPHVSGAAALAWGGHRYANNITIRRLLAATADNLGIPGRNPLYGYGRVDAEQAACELTEPPLVPGIP
jgi:subtilisin